jgi:hypothetical protein
LVNIFAVAAAVSVATIAVTEALITVQRARLKKRFLEELDARDRDGEKGGQARPP